MERCSSKGMIYKKSLRCGQVIRFHGKKCLEMILKMREGPFWMNVYETLRILNFILREVEWRGFAAVGKH